jgi:hypothetical protein
MRNPVLPLLLLPLPLAANVAARPDTPWPLSHTKALHILGRPPRHARLDKLHCRPLLLNVSHATSLPS